MIVMHRPQRLIVLLLMVFLVLPSLVQASDDNILWDNLGHDSRDSLYRNPGAAVPTNTPIVLRLRAANGDLTGAQVRAWNDRIDSEILVDMTLVASNVTFSSDPTSYEFWEATLPASPDPTVYWYRFIAKDGGTTAFYEDDGARTGGWGQTFGSSPDNSWQLTIYDPNFQTPDWVKNAVIYQIFVDRFRDGDPSNNPTAGDFFYGNNDTVFRSNDPEGEWNTRICDPRNALDENVCDGIYSQNFYGGDLQGIIDNLDYLQGLGVTALYLNPIFESPSNHKYDTKDFMQIDDNFGDLATFQALTSQAETRGISIILDGVFNHSSSDSIYFDRYSRWDVNGNPIAVGVNDNSGACESLSSPFVDWYTFFPYEGAGPAPCSDGRDYPKWFGIFDSLPVFQHDYGPVRDYFINNGTSSVGPYWMQWADGWRLDVAPEVDHGTLSDPSDDYWEDFRAAVHAVNPEAYIVGEEWGNPTSWTIDNQWDATMNYQFSAATLSFMRDTVFTDNDFNGGSSAGTLTPIGPSSYAERILNLEERYAPEAFYAMMNLFGSHDTNRLLFLLDHNTSSNNTAQYTDPAYSWMDAMQRMRGAVLLQMTMPGAPTVYYGDEVFTVNPPSFDGSQWQDDPYNRVPYPWLDETGTPYYTHMQNSGTQNAGINLYATLTGIRNSTPALRTGSFDPLLTDDTQGVFAFGRQMADGSSTAIVVANKTNTPRTVTIDLSGYVPAGFTLTSRIMTGSTVVGSNGSITVTVPARYGEIYTMGAFLRPATITDLAATASTGAVDLSWTGSADHYQILRSRLSGGGYELLDTVSDTSYRDESAANATRYYYIVIPQNNDLLTGPASNEVSATPALAIEWANLQWPPTLSGPVSATALSDDIYGQVYIPDATSAEGATEGLLPQVGFGDSTDVEDGTWRWFEMRFNVDVGNNDEFVGNLPLDTVGTFCYTTRYSTDGGGSWFYAVNGPDEGNAACPGPYGVLTVIDSDDTTPPVAPTNLNVTGTSGSRVSLAWDGHPNTDGDLFGFQIWRKEASATDFALQGTVDDPTATSYTDGDVAGGTVYDYYIVAVDTSLNASEPSNTVQAEAIFQPVDVTFRVTVPSFTPGVFPVHIVGPFNGWNPGDPEQRLTEVAPNIWEITLTLTDGDSFEHKFTRGDWTRVEKQADGYEEVPNRFITVEYGTDGTQVVEATVANWRDPIVVSNAPAADATDVLPNTPIVFSWNKWVPTPPEGVTITGPSGEVTGTFSFDEPTLTHMFTPAPAMQTGLHTVLIEGVENAGDVQMVPAEWSFTVVAAGDTTPPSDPTNLIVSETTFNSVSLSWDTHPNTDGDLAGFTLWRDGDPVATINDPLATGYSDDDLSSATSYTYSLTAFDAAGNASAPSNEVVATTDEKTVDVTFRVTVPSFTPGVFPVHLVGPFNGWNPGDPAYMLTEVAPDVWEITLTLPDGNSFEYKVTRGDWTRVEKGPNGYDEVTNRVITVSDSGDGTQLVTATVPNWRDPIVIGNTPAADATDVLPNAPIVFSWNKWVPTPPETTTVTGPAGPVAGTFVFDEPTLTHTFTPDAPLGEGLHTVSISGVANGDDVQQVAASWSFTVVVPNQAPTMTPMSDQTVYETQQVALSMSASDPDGDALTFSDGGTLAPLGLSIDPTTGTISGTVTNGLGGQSFPVVISVSDGLVNASVSFTMTVNAVPDYAALSVCWQENRNNAESVWRVQNPNPPLPNNSKLRFNWTAYDAAGTAIQSAQGLDNNGSVQVNTRLATQLVVEYYVVINNVPSPILGTVSVNADTTGQCSS